MEVLVIDVGGNNVKVLATGVESMLKIRSGRDLTPGKMVACVLEATADWRYEAVTIGVPAPVVRGGLDLEPVNLGTGWVGFDFEAALHKPVKLINDAAMQALGSYEGGRMVFLGLGTGLGTALVVDGVVVDLEFGHMPYEQGQTFEQCLGTASMKQMGKEQWERCVHDVTAKFKAAFVADYVVLGGGNAKKLEALPPGARLGQNRNAFVGGFRLWE